MGFLDKLKAGLGKTKNALMGQIDTVLKAFVKIDEDALEELEEALICADVGVAAADEIIDMLRERIKDDRLKSREDTEIAIREIIADMIGDGEPLNLSTTPSVILVIGVNGAGKTTSIGKISNRLRQEGKKVVVAAADTFRAAAIDQLAEWCKRADVELVKQTEGSDPAAVVYDAANYARNRGADVLIVDTAGRLHNKKEPYERTCKDQPRHRPRASRRGTRESSCSRCNNGSERDPAGEGIQERRRDHGTCSQQARRNRKGRHRPFDP